MKLTTTLTLAVALVSLVATNFASAGLTRATSYSPTRATSESVIVTQEPIYQSGLIMPKPIYATPSADTVPSKSAETIPYVEPQHLTDGLQLVDEINATHSLGIFEDEDEVAVNRYGGSWEDDEDPSFIRFFDEENGILPANNTECAPLITHLLLHTYGWDWGNIEFKDPKDNFDLDTSESPNPWQYLELIRQEKGFASEVTNARQAKPGDIISIHYFPGTTGHTAMLVDLPLGNPQAYPQNGNNLVPELAGTHFYPITILDSTSSPHSNDTREFTVDHGENNITHHTITGAGTGEMGIFLDLSGRIKGHLWSVPDDNFGSPDWLERVESRIRLQHEREMIIGRLPENP